MRFLERPLVFGVVLLALSAQAVAAADLRALGWLAGAWSSASKRGWVEERWAPARGGVMLGTSLSGKGGKANAFEFMRLTQDGDGGISLWASPGGRAPTRFKLSASSASKAVFENSQHDFPTRIEYRREGRALIATISGPGGMGRQSWTFRRQ
jgi:hypothetical protein